MRAYQTSSTFCFFLCIVLGGYPVNKVFSNSYILLPELGPGPLGILICFQLSNNSLCFSPRYLNAIQTMCPHILRYLTTAVITNKDVRKRRQVLKDLVKVIQQVRNRSLFIKIITFISLQLTWDLKSTAIFRTIRTWYGCVILTYAHYTHCF